jgi:hypothetical protein
MLFKPQVRNFVSFYEAVNDLKDSSKSIINSKLMIEVMFDYETKEIERTKFEEAIRKLLTEKLKESEFELKVGIYRGEGHPLCDLKGKNVEGKVMEDKNAIKHNALKQEVMLVHFWSADKQEADENKTYFKDYEDMITRKGQYLKDKKFFEQNNTNFNEL